MNHNWNQEITCLICGITYNDALIYDIETCEKQMEVINSRLATFGENKMLTSHIESEFNSHENDFLAQLNVIRADPMKYLHSLKISSEPVLPAKSLIMDNRLIDCARKHSVDMANKGYFAHGDPGSRIRASGFTASMWAESIAAGYISAADTLKQLIIDEGVPGYGHRKMLLGIGQMGQLNKIGIGFAIGGKYHAYWTIDMGKEL